MIENDWNEENILKGAYSRHIWENICLRYYFMLNIEVNKMHYIHLMLFFTGKIKNPYKQQKNYSIFIGSYSSWKKCFEVVERIKAGDFKLEGPVNFHDEDPVDRTFTPPPHIKIRLEHRSSITRIQNLIALI